MKAVKILALVVVAVIAGRIPSHADVDPRCDNIDLDSHTVSALTNEMQGFVDTGDLSSARFVYQSGVRMALSDYDIAPSCGAAADLEPMDASFEQLVEQAYYTKVIGAGEAQVWLKALLSNAYSHGDTRDQIDAWTVFEHQLAAETSRRFQRPPH